MPERTKQQARKPRKAAAVDAAQQRPRRPSSSRKRPAQTADSRPGISEQQIAERAYAIWRRNGCPHGTADWDWRQAESQLRLLEG